ncbi:MAG TPA: molecular chaperone TorD family protein [Ramlibacter sp.]|nr:molecular chaperone TorD family protein [Ramlibacter sp.]
MPEVISLQQEQDRADVYALLAALLLGPDADLIESLAALPDNPDADDDDVGLAWNALLQSASRGSRAVLDEYEALFIAAGTPRLNPHQCFYLAGWLMDKPLAALREELRELGLVRAPGVTELEDHLGALCETMRVLIERGAPLAVQQAFFARHVAGWAPQCLHDIASAPGADFYRALAAFAQAFFALETAQATAGA